MTNPEPLVLIERDGHVVTVTLNLPAKLNVLNSELVAEGRRAFESFVGADGPRVVVLKGAGRAFVAGADVREMRDLSPPTARAFISGLHDFFAAIMALDAVVIAAIRGPALGAGCELVAACDLRIAADNAIFGMPEVRVGMPSVIEAALLPPLVGLSRAQWLVYTGDVIDAQQALAMGLVGQVVPESALDAEAAALAQRLAGYSPTAMRLQKAIVRRWFQGEAYREAIGFSIDSYERNYEVPDARDAITAFLEKREHRF